MHLYDEVWQDVNTLLSYIRASDVQELIDAKYAKYNNNAPGNLFKVQVARLQKHLDDAKPKRGYKTSAKVSNKF